MQKDKELTPKLWPRASTLIPFLCSAAVALGCGGSGSPTGDASPTSTPELPAAPDAGLTSAPVSSATLSGNAFGQPFVAKSALGTFDTKSGEMHIVVYPEAYPCGDETLRPGVAILLEVPWNRGLARDLKDTGGPDSQGATFYDDDGHSPLNELAFKGRVEVIEAPTAKGAHGVVRLRASFAESSVEGQVSVEVCALR